MILQDPAFAANLNALPDYSDLGQKRSQPSDKPGRRWSYHKNYRLAGEEPADGVIDPSGPGDEQHLSPAHGLVSRPGPFYDDSGLFPSDVVRIQIQQSEGKDRASASAKQGWN